MTRRTPEAVATCRVCGQGFARQTYLDLHIGHEHGAALTDAERAAFERALAEEEAFLGRFQRHVRGGLAGLPVVLLYAFLLIIGIAYGVPPALPLLLLPGVLAFTALFYYIAYTHEPRPDA